MALGSHKDRALTKAEILLKAQEMDDRRQEQIKKQSGVIDRLLTEHQMLLGVVEELADSSPLGYSLSDYRVKAKEVLANIEKLREDIRKKKEKQDGE